MMLQYTFKNLEAAKRIEDACNKVLESGLRTADIFEPGCQLVSTSKLGDAIAAAV
jgi:3-isopropylmalate dehydrogenase